ncbi:hypothetical protein BD770DRAFT_397922 [Pilaira anomala]|nr:hypothetical protein BD770DRAFT_397922 [Pilaira anomala]
MTSSIQHNYEDSIASDDSFDWSSDSAPKSKRRTTRKTKNSDTKKTKKNATADNAIKKANKPGRKPFAKVNVLPSDPKLKRKAQNRAAQRAFRERKERFVTELQEEIRQLQQTTDKREKELALENARLKKENKRLKEENYILKDAKFTFEFPSKTNKIMGKSQPNSPIVSPSDQLSPENQHSELSMGSSLSGEEDTLTLPETYNQDLTHQGISSPLPATTTTTSFVGPTTTDPAKLSLTPTMDINEQDYLSQTEPLPQLFGNEMDLFGVDSPAPFSTPQLDPLFSEQMQSVVDEDNFLKCAPENEKPCKKKIIAVLDRARGTNRRMYEVHQDVKSYCPDINLDQLCDDLRQKITFDSNHILTDADVDLYIECIQRNT